jgi:hypothetical protein
MLILSGQLIAKRKQSQSEILEAGSLYNIFPFLLDTTHQENVYCLSSEAIVLIINKNVLKNTFKA